MNVARCLKLHDLIFVFPFAFKNKHRFENFFSFIMEGMGTLSLFEFELSQNYRDVTAIISHSVSIFLLNASLMPELVIFIFHNENILFST